MSKKRTICCLVVNIIISLSTIIVTVIGLTEGAGEGQVGFGMIGLRYFMPYTMDSNILNGLFSLFIVIFCINRLVNMENEVPKWAIRLQCMGAVCTGLTFIVVLLFLAPGQVVAGRSFLAMYSNDMFFFHFLNPLLAAFSFMFLESGHSFTRIDNRLMLIPTVCYTVVYTVQVGFIKQWPDFYGFTFGGKMYLTPISIVLLWLVTYGIGHLYIRVHNKREQKKETFSAEDAPNTLK